LGITFKAEQLALRIHYGAGQDLLALLNLKGIGRVRARKLYLSGITSIEKLNAADRVEVARLLGPKIAEKVFTQLKKSERHEEHEGHDRKEIDKMQARKEIHGVQERLP
jgi:helicase